MSQSVSRRADPTRKTPQQRGRRAFAAAAFAAAVAACIGGFAVLSHAQERPFWEQSDSYGEQRRTNAAARAPRRDDAYRSPDANNGPPGGFGSQPAPYGGPGYGGQQPYDSGRPYETARPYGSPGAEPQGYDAPPAYGGGQQPPPYRESWQQPQQPRGNDAYSPGQGQPQAGWNPPPAGGNPGYGDPYSPPPAYGEPQGGQGYGQGGYGQGGYNQGGQPGYAEPPRRTGGTYSQNEVIDSGHRFFGSISQGLANAVEQVFKSQGRPNGYILGEDAGGAFLAGLRYGEGTLFTKDAGNHKVFWQGPSLGYDFGGEGSKTMVLVYNLRDPSDIYTRYGGVQGSAYVIGGVGVQFQKHEHVTLAVIRSGVGLRLGANVGYLKYTRRPTWNPF